MTKRLLANFGEYLVKFHILSPFGVWLHGKTCTTCKNRYRSR